MTALHVVHDMIGGRFQLVRLIGSGGQGEVHLAKDIDLGIDVVLKSRPVRDEQALVQLRREARVLMGVVPHRGLPVVRSDLVDSGRYILISDYVDGRDLESVLASQGDPGLPVQTALGYLAQIADSLDHLHGHRPAVVHGDIKPANLVLANDGRVVIIDFGTALRVGECGERIGTPGFTAPEVVAGEAITPAADVFSLAAVAVALLTGRAPTAGASMGDDLRSAKAEGLERVLRRALSFDPARRPPTAPDLVTQLREAAEMDLPTGTVTLAYFASSPPNPRQQTDIINEVERTGGNVVTNATVPTGGLAAVFTRVSDAATAALNIVDHGTSATCTAGLHVGDLGGWHGATLQQLVGETIQLTSTALVGSVVCSPPTRMLLGRDGAHHFTPTSHGFRINSVHVTAIADSVGVQEANTWIAVRRIHPIFGRESTFDAVRVAVAADHDDQRASMVVLAADPGIGKTRVLAELGAQAVEAGHRVLIGRCTESGGAFEPFVDALGEEVFDLNSGQFEWEEGGWIDRRRFFTRVATTLETCPSPVTLIFDDLQWIDGASVALLSHLLSHLGSNLTVLAGCRNDARTPAFGDFIARLDVHSIGLAPLLGSELAQLAAINGVRLSEQALDTLRTLTNGNPFFALQVFDHLRGQDADELDNPDLPTGVLEWVGNRVARLGDQARSVLGPAAVIGRTFDVLLLADLIGAGPLELLTHLERAVDAGLLIEGVGVGEFRFVHEIVQSSLINGLSQTRQALLHATLGERLEANGSDLDNLELAAHHWLKAGRLGNPVHAAEIAVQVATLALERLAHERAHAIIQQALGVLQNAPPSTTRDIAEANLRLVHGRADFFASEMERALKELFRAAALAEAAGADETFAEAALAASMHRRHGVHDPDLLDLLDAAGQRCPPHRPELRAMLHVRRSRLLPTSVRQPERIAVARKGLEDLPRMTAINRASIENEVARACWGPDDATDRLLIASRHIEQARLTRAAGGASRWAGVLIEGLNHRSAARIQLGELTGALEDARAAAKLADEVGSTFLLTRVRMGEALILAILGAHHEAESLASEMVELANHRHNLVLARMAISFCVGRDQGRQAELADLESRFQELVDENPLFVSAFALIHAEAGRMDDATRLMGRLAAVGLGPRNWLWLGVAVATLETAVLLGDLQAVRRYTHLLISHSGQ